jgi:hypothetical protein
MNERMLRKLIRELTEAELKEFDILVKKKAKDKMVAKKEDWEEEKKELKDNLSNLLSHIEADEYEEGAEKIDDVVSQLQDWKKKINNFL